MVDFFIVIVAIVAEILLPNLNGFMVFLFYLVSGLIWISSCIANNLLDAKRKLIKSSKSYLI